MEPIAASGSPDQGRLRRGLWGGPASAGSRCTA